MASVRTTDVHPGESPQLVINIKWMAHGAGRQSASIVITPWLAYGVSVGARVKHAQTGQYATVTKIRDDDLCEVIADNAASQSEDNKHNPAVVRVDPRPDTCSRTASPSYKPGQKLLLLHDGAPVDAIVEEWLGVRRGSRHRVRLSKAASSAAAAEEKGGKSRASKEQGSASKETMDVDLNENHEALPNCRKV